MNTTKLNNTTQKAEKLENIKKYFNKYEFSLVFSVVNNNRMNVTITDAQEKKPYCGISSKNIDDVESFLRKNLEKIKKIAWFTWHYFILGII